MTLVQFLRVFARHLGLMLLCGTVAAGTVFYMTRNAKKEYGSHTLINTGLVSGYNIESQQGGRIDYAYTNNEMENIIGVAKSRETLEELGNYLLAEAMLLDAATDTLMGNAAFQELHAAIPADVWQQVVVSADRQATRHNIVAWRNRPGENPVKNILNGKHDLFGIEHLQSIVVRREGNSDMIRIAYTTSDPGMCRFTIATLSQLFIRKHQTIKEGQSANVLAFFDQATKESASNLSAREDNLLDFMVQNKIINYYEQTRYIAAAKEDLDEFYFKELMKLAAADSSRRNLETRLETRVQLPEINRTLLALREQLSGVNTQLAAQEIAALTDSMPRPERSRTAEALTRQADQLKNTLRQTASATFAVQRTPEGVETTEMLHRWLDQWLEVEQTLARLEVLRDRKTEFERIYSQFAPWGSKLKRYEREIDVAERAYLENLHSYNQARLHKHNTMMASNLRIVDAPYHPNHPNASKRLIMIALAFIAVAVLILGAAIAMVLLDNSIATPERAAAASGLPFAAAFPRLPSRWAKHRTLDFPAMMTRSTDQLLQQIKLDLRKRALHQKPARIALISSREGEGKGFVAEKLVEKLRLGGEKVLLLQPEHNAPAIHPDNIFFPVNDAFFEKNSEAELLNSTSLDPQQYAYIITELPALLSGNYPVDYLATTDTAILIARANRTWNTADSRAVDNLQQIVGKKPMLVLNGCTPDNMETAIGEIPKYRSAFRRQVKKMATFNMTR